MYCAAGLIYQITISSFELTVLCLIESDEHAGADRTSVFGFGRQMDCITKITREMLKCFEVGTLIVDVPEDPARIGFQLSGNCATHA